MRATPGLLQEVLTLLDRTEITDSEATEIAKKITSPCAIKTSWNEQTDNFAMLVFRNGAAAKQAVSFPSQKVLND